MNLKPRAGLLALGIGFLFVGCLSAQSVPFQLFILDQNSNSVAVGNGSTVTLAANAANQSVTVTLVATYAGAGHATVTGPTQLFGPSSEFSVASPSSSPFSSQNLNPGDSFSVKITFTPMGINQASAIISIPYTETVSTATSSGSIALSLIGTVPNFAVSYFFQANDNVMPLANGGTLTFPPTRLATTSAAGIMVQNIGRGSGLISSVTVSGSAFQALALPVLPGSLAASSILQFTIQYTPTQAPMDTGTLQITFPDHTVTINLVGSGTGSPPLPSDLVFSYTTGAGALTVPGSGAVIFSSVQIGQTSSSVFSIQNAGTTPASVISISLQQANSPFTLTGLPNLPLTLAPNASLSFTIVFSPSATGQNTATLVINAQVFTLVGSGTPSDLVYSYTTGAAGAQTVPANGSVNLGSVPIGQSTSSVFSIQNAALSENL